MNLIFSVRYWLEFVAGNYIKFNLISFMSCSGSRMDGVF